MASIQLEDSAMAPRAAKQKRKQSLAQLSESMSDNSFHDLDWSMYDYHPADDGGFWKLQPEYPASDRYPDEIPLTATSRSPVQKSQDIEWTCLSPACPAKPFKRKADLDRHYKLAHAETPSKGDSSPKEVKDKDTIFYCDYSNCLRSREGFTRKDRFRVHIQETHKEDVNKKGGKFEDKWLETRRISAKWWRCSKCLDRVKIEDHGYECPGCNGKCEKKRRELREALSEM